jgi:hypothetical protein
MDKTQKYVFHRYLEPGALKAIQNFPVTKVTVPRMR